MNNLEFKSNKLYILDQTLLPNEEKWVQIKSKEDAYYAIKSLMVRGAPAIGIFAGKKSRVFGHPFIGTVS